MKIPFSPPFIDEETRQEVLSVLDSGWITTGPKVQELEKLVSALNGVSHTVCCNSATSGMILALHWFGIGDGDEVIIPSYTYAATALAVMHVGATPVMVDCCGDFTIDTQLIREQITERTKAFLPVDIGGWPCDYASLQQIVTSDSVKNMFRPTTDVQRQLGRPLLLSDAAHSLGARVDGRPVAQSSDLTVFSFHAVKNVTTAEGGAIAINLPTGFDHGKVWADLKLWSMNGQTKDAFTKTVAGGWKYDIVYPGFKMNLPDVCAAVGLSQIRKYESSILPARRRVVAQYVKAFSAYPWAQMPSIEMGQRTSSYHLFQLRLRGINEQTRDRVIDEITAQGVSVNVHFMPLPMLTVFRERGYNIEDFPVAYDNYSREISLPVYPQLTPEMTDHVIGAVVSAFNKVGHG